MANINPLMDPKYMDPFDPEYKKLREEYLAFLQKSLISPDPKYSFYGSGSLFSGNTITYKPKADPMVIAEPQTKQAVKKKANTKIVGVKYKLQWIFLGNTYDYKESLKRHGVVFDGDSSLGFGKVWYYPSVVLPSGLQEMIEWELDVDNPGQIQQLVQQNQTDPEGISERIREIRRKRVNHQGKHYPLYERKELGAFSDFVPPSWFEELIFYLNYPEEYPVVVIVGPSGNGKTKGAEQAYLSLERHFSVLDVNEYLEPYHYIGGEGYDPHTGKTWNHGFFTKAFENGWDMLVNEFDAANPRAVLCIQSGFQTPGKSGKERYITVTDHPNTDRIYPQAACQIVLTMNTFGSGANMQFVGRNALDLATLDRVAFISTGYENEVKILMAGGYDSKLAKQLEKWAIENRKKIDKHMLRVTLSLRLLKRMAHMITTKGIGLEDAAEKAFYSRLEDSDVKLLRTGSF